MHRIDLSSARRRAARGGCLLLTSAAVLLPACSDLHPLLPEPAPPALIEGEVACTAVVATRSLVCEPNLVAPPASAGALFGLIVGGQDVYVKLTGENTAYDAGDQLFRTDVRLQNLMRQAIGTRDGTTPEAVRIYFHTEPTVTGGTGSVAIRNADGTGVFTGSNQEFFSYAEILQPNAISAARTWEFDVPTTVTSFRFTVYVSAPVPDETGPLLQRVWGGTSSATWSLPANWSDGAVPDSASAVSVLSDSLFSGEMPVLSESVALTHLRVGTGSTLGLAGHTLTAWGNVDAAGALSGGTLRMGGDQVVLVGSVDALVVSGNVRLQGTTRAAGAVSITGSLATDGHVLTISVP